MQMTVYEMVRQGIPEGNIVATIMARESKETTMTYVAWGDKTGSFQITEPMDLGVGPRPGLRKLAKLDRLVHAAAFGYVSGFPLVDIAYYLATRHSPYWHYHASRDWPDAHCRQTKRDGEWIGVCRKCIKRLGTERMPWLLEPTP